jgi:hypothetical protein
MKHLNIETYGAFLAKEMWFSSERRVNAIRAIGQSARAACAEVALAGYELGLNTTRLTRERKCAAQLADELYIHIADTAEDACDLGPDEVDLLGDLAETLLRVAQPHNRSVVVEEPTGYREILNDMADEALSRANIRSFR